MVHDFSCMSPRSHSNHLQQKESSLPESLVMPKTLTEPTETLIFSFVQIRIWFSYHRRQRQDTGALKAGNYSHFSCLLLILMNADIGQIFSVALPKVDSFILIKDNFRRTFPDPHRGAVLRQQSHFLRTFLHWYKHSGSYILLKFFCFFTLTHFKLEYLILTPLNWRNTELVIQNQYLT